jgi:hypothetical protein
MSIDNFRNKISPMPHWGSNKQITMYLIVVNPSRAWAIFISKVVYLSFVKVEQKGEK